jgi:hypothetical protein
MRFLRLDPAVFTHAYLLLAEHPERFDDISYYLSTIRTFFERSDATGGIVIPPGANPDIKRRLGEDLGVGLAACFMVNMFGVMWETICQIPQNTKLSAKRPDFEGFASVSERFLFEAKGTTALRSVETFLTKALAQVKGYPEYAAAKIAIVSYLSADERFFPSTSFVVDPPELPQGIEPDYETARLLHFEKVLQFVGLSGLAKNYLEDLSSTLAREHREKARETISWYRREPPTRLRVLLANAINERLVSLSDAPTEFANRDIIGRSLIDRESRFELFLGADRRALEAGVKFVEPSEKLPTRTQATDTEWISQFSDGTLLRMARL